MGRIFFFFFFFNKNNNDGGKKDKPPSTTVILKVNMHCDGYASKIIRLLCSFKGVESDAGKLTVTGKVDPSQLSEKLTDMMKKKVDLIFPQPNKENKLDNKSQKKKKKKPEDKVYFP